MVFSSLTFLFAYLPIVLILYFTVPIHWRNPVLLAVSLFFYGWGEPIYILLMLFSIVMNYLCGIGISKYLSKDKEKAKKILILCIVINVGLLAFFKYTDFLIGNLNSLGLSIKPLGLSLPIGISFYTFQAMSYPIDLYRGQTDVQKSLINFGTYVTMFPQLIAGPIVRYSDVAKQLEYRTVDSDRFYFGIRRFMVGLCKKLLLANTAGQVWESISALTTVQQSAATAWIGIICYAFQIYFDFSGYSDMAIGLGKMLGFDFLENFNYPYIAQSITDFWRRWHMSLSFWFRDYVYIPLGGNRRGMKRQIMNILIVWLLTGLWHGASWNFVIWGLIYGFILIIEKLFLLKKLEKTPSFIRHLYTLFIILIAWVFFAFTDLSKAISYIGFLFGSAGLIDSLTVYYLRNNFFLMIVCIIACTPSFTKAFNAFMSKDRRTYLYPLLILAALIICTAFTVDASYNPFLYFRF